MGRNLIVLGLSVLIICCKGQRSSVQCGLSSSGLDGLFGRSAVLIFGEIHGTEQFPSFVAEVACRGSADGSRILLALEIPEDEQPRIDAFVAGTATVDDLVSSDFWQRSFQDGRSSGAMKDLLVRVRSLRRQGSTIEITAFVTAETDDPEREYADNVSRAIARYKPSSTLVLVGNWHSPKTRASPESELPMAGHLVEHGHKVISLDGETTGGTAWVCTDECGVQSVRGAAVECSKPVHLRASEDGAYDGYFCVGPVTASFPAATSGSHRAVHDR